MMRLPELLAPAGGMDALRAAVENGADAVYLGGQAFNARASAANFSREELTEAIEYAHLRNVRIYVTVNVLIDNGEMTELLEYLQFLYTIGVDAVILQDLGVAYLIKNVLPELPVHASTQMTIVNSAGVKLAGELGFERIVLARETSLRNMAEIYRVSGAELEVFIHGALCVGYSGQCLMSSMIGGRSGNRGRCAQPCRMTYELVDLENKTEVPGLDVGEHLLSPRDLNLLDYLGELAEAGICSLKVEGRMKRPEYVATVIAAYREVLDRLAKGAAKGSEEQHRELAQIFNRDFTPGHLFGFPGKELMSYKRPNNRGVMLGRVSRYDRDKGTAQIKLETWLNKGDGIEAWTKKGREGLYVQKMWRDKGQEAESAGPGEQVWLEMPGPVSIGDRIFKTHDEKLVSKARESYQRVNRRIPVDFELQGRLGEPLRILVSDPGGNTGEGVTGAVLERAEKRPLTEDYLAGQLSRLGNTPFVLNQLVVYLGDNLIVPVREINEARRKAIEALQQARLGKARPNLTLTALETSFRALTQNQQPKPKFKNKLAVSVGDLPSLRQAVASGADIIYFGGDQFRSKKVMDQEELAQAAEYCYKKGVTPVLRMPRLVHEHRLQFLQGYLTRAVDLGLKTVQAADLGTLAVAKEFPGLDVYTDYSLNVFNDLSLRALESYGVKLACLSPELNFGQLEQFAQLKRSPFELLVHGSLPLMITEYCALGSLLGGGKREGCSRPCQHKVYGFKDRMNFVFPLETDQNCRMYVYNPKELNLLEHLLRVAALKPDAIRLELRKEQPGYVGKVTGLYRSELNRLLANPAGYRPDPQNLEAMAGLRPGGFTKGHYFRGVL